MGCSRCSESPLGAVPLTPLRKPCALGAAGIPADSAALHSGSAGCRADTPDGRLEEAREAGEASQVVLLQKHLAKALHSSQLTQVDGWVGWGGSGWGGSLSWCMWALHCLVAADSTCTESAPSSDRHARHPPLPKQPPMPQPAQLLCGIAERGAHVHVMFVYRDPFCEGGCVGVDGGLGCRSLQNAAALSRSPRPLCTASRSFWNSLVHSNPTYPTLPPHSYDDNISLSYKLPVREDSLYGPQ